MKLAHKNLKDDDEPGDLLNKAKQLEKQGEMEEAASVYEKIIRKDPFDENAYNRLMIIHRKNKEYKKEKAILDAAIKAFQQLYAESLRLPVPPRIKSLSKQILKATGLADKSGNLLYEREPLYRWNKRRELVIKKIKK